MSAISERVRSRAMRDLRSFCAHCLSKAVEPNTTIDSVRERDPRSFDEIVGKIRRAGTVSLRVCGDDYQFEGGLRLQQRTNEFAALCLFLRERGLDGAYLEIGTASGGTCRFLQGLLGSSQILSLDDGQHPDAHMQGDNFAGLKNLSRFVGDSHTPAAKRFIESKLAKPLAVAFIDGDHSYGGVLQDTQLVLPFTCPGTLLVYHDTVAVSDVRWHWVLGASSGMFLPLAHFVDDRPGALGIGVAIAVSTSRPKTALRAIGRRSRPCSMFGHPAGRRVDL